MSTKVAFEGVKTLNGRALEAGQFEFGLYDANGYLLQTVTNDADGKVTFAEIEYTYREIRAQQSADGTATIHYTIREIVPNNAAPGYTYDTNEYPVTVTLKLSDDETELLADVTYPAETGLTFTNSYAAEGSATISGTKTVTGATKIREAFAFTIKDGDDTICAILTATGGDGDKVSIPYPTFKYVVDPAATAGTAYDAANKVITVTVNSAADLAAKTYTIAEVAGENEAYTFDSSVYTLTVTPTDNGNGELTVTPVLTKNGETAAAADFTNVYTGSLNIKKNVSVDGKATSTTLADGTYNFEVYSDAACTTSVAECSITVTNGQSSTATISDLTPANYYVKEVSGTNANVKLMEGPVSVTVSGDATDEVETAVFTNDRDTSSLRLQKFVFGTSAADKEFTFRVTIPEVAGLTFNALDENLNSTRVTFNENGQLTVTLKANGSLTITELPVGAAYTVEETALPDGYHTVKDTSTGTISKGSVNIVHQTNVYEAQGSATISGTKTVTGATKIREAFAFTIKDSDDNTICTIQTATGGDGDKVSIPYPTFKYVVDRDATAGTSYDAANKVITVTVNDAADLAPKTYTISEKSFENTPYTYDSSTYTLTVSATDNGNGTLTITPVLTKNGETAAAADFTNAYYGSLKIQKNVTVGGAATTTKLADGTYNFKVYSDAACTTSVAECSITVTNGQSSTATISGLTPADYYVKEVSGTNANVKLMEGPVSVTVSDDATADVETAVFTNDRGVGNLGLSKRVYGTAAADKEFTFRVTIPEVAGLTFNATKNGNSTRVTFNENGQLTVTLKANDTLIISNLPDGAAFTVEEIDLPAGYTASKNVNTKTGTITAGSQIIWSQVNVYAAQGSATISGTKTVTGATKIREAFAFTIKDSDDHTICTILTATGGDGDKVSIPYPTFKYVVDRDATAGTSYDAENKVITVTVNSAADLAQKVYTISEKTAENTPYTYDKSVYTLTVTPTDNGNGTLTVTPVLTKNGETAAAADFTNAYYGSLKIQKNVTVGGAATTTTLADGTYDFVVYSDAECTKRVDACSITITNGQSSTATISGLVPATYYVKETGSTNENVQPLTDKVTVIVSGDATAEVPTAAFTNNRGMGELMLKKTVTGTNAADKEFTFMVIVDAAAGMTYPATYNGSNQTQPVTFDSNGMLEVTLKANDTLIISNLPDGSPYTVSETDLPDGYTATTIEGAIGSISGNATATVTQTNAYAAQGSATISGTKTLTNATFIRDAFEFEIKDGNTTVYTAVTATDVEGETVSIPYPTFKYVVDPAATAGTTYDAENKVITVTVNSAADLAQKVYTISEKTAANTPYTYDESVYTLTVTPTDNGNGKLTVTAVLTMGESAANAADFTNVYTGSLKIQKNVTVGDAATSTTLADGTYVFKVYSNAACTDSVGGSCSITITNGQSNTATISGLTPRTYYVKEISSTNENVQLLPNPVEVTVSGDATADVETAVFTNDRGTSSLRLQKYVFGTSAADKEFTFKVTIPEVAGLTFNALDENLNSTRVTFNENGQLTVTLKANGSLTITELPVGAAYTVEETALPDGYTAVKDSSTGTISKGSVNIVHQKNVYAAQGSATISGTKTAAGASMIREAFTFEIKDGDQTVYTAVTATDVEGSTVSIPYPTFKYVVDRDATAGITYDADNEIITVTVNSAADLVQKVYTISEKKGANDSYTYDESVYTLTVTPTDNGDGTLTVTPVLTKGEATAAAADFTNIYTRDLIIKKNVTVGGLATDTTLADGEYSFEVYSDEDCTDRVAECSITITNGQSSTATITGLTPAVYYVKEVGSTNPNVTLMPDPVTVTVSGDANVVVPMPEFTNNRGVGSLMLMKTVTGTEAADKEFTFVVTVEAVAGMTYPAEHSANAELQTVTFDETGKVTVTLKANETMLIKDLPHGAAYTVEEIDLPAGYASTNGDTTEGAIASDATATIIHDNTYTAYGEADLLVSKQVADYSGDGTFTFILCDEEGTEIDTATCGANETATFATIDYQLPGIYHYTITEVTPELADRVPGMQYNSDTCYATVTVTDNGDGTLTAVVTYGTAEDAVTEESLTITNVYNKPEGTAELSVTKALTGNTDAYTADEDFIFELAIDEHELTSETNNVLMPIDETETEANAVATAKVGEQAFWKLKYDEPGTYTYTITEVEGATPGMIYDTSAHTVTVIVEYTEDLMALKTSVIYVTEEDEPDADDPTVDDPTTDDPTTDDPTTDDPSTDDPTTDDPNTDDPTTDDPTTDDPTTDDPTTDDPTTDDPNVDDPSTDDPNVDDPNTDDPEADDPEADDPEADDPEADDPEADDPEADDPEADVPVTTLTITNKYGEISYQPMIKKIVDGTGAPDETFTFTLTDGEGYEETASCKAGETAMFSEIVYHAPGTYTYTVTENTPSRKTDGMTYSKQVVTITVTVVSAEDGTLEATAEYTDEGTITNKFVPPPKYDYKFSFTKKWSGGVEGSIEWTLYNPDGSVAHKKFNKKVISETEWSYEAWFMSDKDYYIIEDVPEGYTAIYVNVGKYADVTDRLYNGGTIINKKIPKTGDSFDPLASVATLVVSSSLLAALLIRNGKRKRSM